MKRFLLRLTAFLLPVVLLAAAMLGALAASGEMCRISDVAARMADGEPLRFELNYRANATAQLKSETAAARGAELLVLGTSRTMQFRAAMFPDGDFYNAGGAVSTLGQMLPFLQSLPPEKLPRTLIVGLDQYFFNAEWDAAVTSDADYAPTVDAVRPLAMLESFLHHCGEGKINLLRLLQADERVIGVPARVRGSGFLSDGSYRYGAQAADGAVDLTFSDARGRIADGSNRFQYGEEVSAGALNILHELLGWCSEQGIQVVGYLPPYAPGIRQAMLESGRYAYMDAIYGEILEIFDIFDMECYDFTGMPDTQDAEFVDGFHAGDAVYCKMLLAMLQQSSCLAQYTDAAALDALLQQAENARVLADPNDIL